MKYTVALLSEFTLQNKIDVGGWHHVLEETDSAGGRASAFMSAAEQAWRDWGWDHDGWHREPFEFVCEAKDGRCWLAKIVVISVPEFSVLKIRGVDEKTENSKRNG